MRPLGKSLRREPPHAGEGRVMQAKPPVACEHGDALGQIVERLALHADHFLETTVEIEPLGDVVEQIGDAAVRIGRGDDAQGAAVGQVPSVFLGLDRAIGFEQLRLPLPEILLFRQLAGAAQRLDDRGVGRLLVEIGGVEIPKRAIGGVVEGQPVVGAEHGDTGGELIERAAVGIDHAGERNAHGFRFGGVKPNAGAAGVGAEIEHVEGASGACDHGRQPAGIGAVGRERAQNVVARRAVEKLEAARDGVVCGLGFDGARIGGIGEGQLARGVARPDRRRQVLDQGAQRSDFAQQVLVPRQKLDQVALDAASVFQAQHGAAADGAALHFDRMGMQGGQRQRKTFAAAAQVFDRPLHGESLAGFEPTAESEHAMRRGNADDRRIAVDMGLIGAGRPIHHHLRFGKQQRIGAVEIAA